ncbi:FtsX-like permease family protein [Varunaivibrio sulfuroxidans]|uniref:Putative ABC transport system permease protein n=1 Tax=Varunaivibrio sulfuroxidans TaxID=1773489 RepID=A0A4V2UNQ6_9PROT|nr:ABC transporter permease [Varunaivibrio sulfuroxidans]TCS62981.1 putative ABC transport system permease protein [Varunaivibrio sulfuroxidans]WES31941.1 FtsX-like permease family protein [Varunaivibrio sulfuroxidans]
MALIKLWLGGLIAHRAVRVVGVVAGISLAVSLLMALGAFVVSSSVSMSARAVSAVPIDWQVELVPTASPSRVETAIKKAAKIQALHTVRYAQVAGLVASPGKTTQTTGPGKAIAFDAGYAKDFPKEVRLLAGKLDGVLIAQQTAANLHVRPGDTVRIKRVGLAPASVVISGVVGLPDADALFQGVGLPKQAAPQAPPDNVLILPEAQWMKIFDPQRQVRPGSVRLQFHVRLARAQLPANPEAAFVFVTGAARNLEARVAGQALVSDNLGARLDAVRGDSLYARVLFLFLGVPGVALAAIMTMAVTTTNAGERRRERAVLRTRGASRRQIVIFAASEAAFCGILGVLIGMAITVGFPALTGHAPVMPDGLSLALSCALALGVVFLALVLPVLREGRSTTIAASRAAAPLQGTPLWARTYADLALLALAGLFFWQSASTGYRIVLAPEGVATTAVDYKAFISPALFWLGIVLFSLRITRLALRRGGGVLTAALRPWAGALAPAVSAAMTRQSFRLSFGVAMLALAISFAVSTSIFNKTYNGQARVDAELTNGADVTVFGSTDRPAAAYFNRLKALPGVASGATMAHRFAYVGADLQDIYGIDPATITKATHLADAYFVGQSAQSVLEILKRTPNGVLVSQETVHDFQLTLGDTLNLRLMDMRTHQYRAIPFVFVGVVREFPTAPKDSFLVANAAYLAQMTRSSAREDVLLKAKGDPAALAGRVKSLLRDAPSLRVTDIGQAAHIIGSNLAAVDLRGLTGIELSFAAIMAASASGLLLLLGLFERRRAFAVLNVIGSKPRQLAVFIWSEGLFVLAGGLLFGVAGGVVIAAMLVKLLTGVFDPPPEVLAWPLDYLVTIVGFAAVSLAAALVVTTRRASRSSADLLRER